MKALPAISLIALCGLASAQTSPVDEEKDPVIEAILEFNKRKAARLAEEIPPAEEPEEDAPAKAVPVDESVVEGADTPVLVTGKPPGDIDVEVAAEPAENPPVEPAVAEVKEEEVFEEAPPASGPAVRVEKIRHGQAAEDVSQIQLRAPFPAKPLSSPSTGWKLVTSDNAPDFIREVELAPGSTITLTIRPHLLRPEVDGDTTFEIPEPGYDPALGYHQSDTVGAILGTSILQLDEDAKQLGQAIDRLQQLLISLPKPKQESSAAPQ